MSDFIDTIIIMTIYGKFVWRAELMMSITPKTTRNA